LRLVGCLSLFLKHGLEKIFTFSVMAPHFLGPLYIGPVATLMIATLSDSVCSLLVLFGLATRWAALYCFVNIFVAWALVHHFLFFGQNADHGELVVLYLAIMLNLFFAGAGKCSLDSLLDR
jgi:putative oxidoreductase